MPFGIKNKQNLNNNHLDPGEFDRCYFLNYKVNLKI